jgi:hypothetical protein
MSTCSCTIQAILFNMTKNFGVDDHRMFEAQRIWLTIVSNVYNALNKNGLKYTKWMIKHHPSVFTVFVYMSTGCYKYLSVKLWLESWRILDFNRKPKQTVSYNIYMATNVGAQNYGCSSFTFDCLTTFLVAIYAWTGHKA